MPLKSKLFIQTLQKSQDRHEISFSFEFNNKNIKKVFGANLPPPCYNSAGFYPDTIRVNKVLVNYYINWVKTSWTYSKLGSVGVTCYQK